MKFIAHRGNLNGKNVEMENHPDYIDKAIEKGYDVEIDIWCIKTGVGFDYFLGHDEPQYQVDMQWLIDNSEFLWCHAKNLDALHELIHLKWFNVFWHGNDDYTLTSQNFIWTYPNKPIVEFSFKQIILLFDFTDIDMQIPYGGICSDEIELYREKYEN